MKTELTDEYFLNLGYKQFDLPPLSRYEMFECMFQKCFRDDCGKKYFINVLKNDNKYMASRYGQEDWFKPYTYSFSCQLYKKVTHAAVNMEFFSDWTIKQVEEFVERLFKNGELDYYERWDEQ